MGHREYWLGVYCDGYLLEHVRKAPAGPAAAGTAGLAGATSSGAVCVPMCMRTGAGTMLAARAHTTKRDAVLAQAIAVAPGGGLQGGLELWCGHILARATHRTGNMVVVWLEGLCQADIRCPAAHMHGGNANALEHLQRPVDASAIAAWRCGLGATGGRRGGGPLGDMGPLKWLIGLLQDA